MNYSGIIYNDTGNAAGISTTLFVSGCEHNCPGCHNPETHSEYNGDVFNKDVTNEIIESLKKPYVKNFILSGGDPFYKANRVDCIDLIQNIREELNKIGKEINIIVYTGYMAPRLTRCTDETILNLVMAADIIIDGRFRLEEKGNYLDLRGSENQQAWRVDRERNCIYNISKDYFRHITREDRERYMEHYYL